MEIDPVKGTKLRTKLIHVFVAKTFIMRKFIHGSPFIGADFNSDISFDFVSVSVFVFPRISRKVLGSSASIKKLASSIMHPPLTIHRHPMCAEIIEQFQKCHIDHPLGKFFGECTDLKLKLDKCFRQEKALRRKANFEESKKLKERLREYRKENLETRESKAFAQA
ncbi:uncharacterized protein [Primulina eburnea]|uniref:uncharacterized protein isoform X1 n=2 Tax=Primulina eburnea TaxID=1245227 RepID=UPI003C6C81B7